MTKLDEYARKLVYNPSQAAKFLEENKGDLAHLTLGAVARAIEEVKDEDKMIEIRSYVD